MDKETREIINNFKIENEKSHNLIMDKINIATTINTTMKWAIGVFVSIIIVLLTIIASYSRLQYQDSKEASKMNIQTYMMMAKYKQQLDSIMVLQKEFLKFKSDATSFYDDEYSRQIDWTKKIYDSLIIPTDKRSKYNNRVLNNIIPRLDKLEMVNN